MIVNMELKEFLKINKKKGYRQQFCDEVEIHYQHLNNILRGIRHPSPALAKRIETATGGKVKAISLLYPEQ
jgi:transcriptional regulator with XRE-family HTH domain